MSRVRADRITNREGTGAPSFPSGAVVTGFITATDATITGNLSVGGTITYDDVTNVDSVGLITARNGVNITGGSLRVGTAVTIAGGIVTATSFSGDGSGLSGVVSGIELEQAGSSVGTSLTAINFASGATLTAGSGGISTITIAAGISTEDYSPVSGIITLDLSNQDHKVTATGIATITPSGGTEGDSHTIRVINSGITTLSLSSHFLFPSGAVPTFPTADGAIHLISCTVHREGTTGISTQLLSGASLNYS